MKEEEIRQEAVSYIKANKKRIIEEFLVESLVEEVDIPDALFMAGSPGAGKTEFSNMLIKLLGKSYIRIDADDIREKIPQYNGNNSDLIQLAATIGVENLHNYIVKRKYNYIMDSTFSNFDKQKQNVSRALKRGKNVLVFFVYQTPEVAWKFVKAREKEEGRKVPKQVFIHKFLDSIETAQRIKEYFGDKIVLSFVMKNIDNLVQKFEFNVKNIDIYMETKYTYKKLDKLLNKEL